MVRLIVPMLPTSRHLLTENYLGPGLDSDAGPVMEQTAYFIIDKIAKLLQVTQCHATGYVQAQVPSVQNTKD